MAEVSRTPTPLDEKTAASELVEKIIPNFGKDSFIQQFAELILAQIWLETGRGRSMMNNNWGNITAGNNWPGDFWRPPWFVKDEVLALPETTDAQKANKKKLLFLHDEMLANRAPSKFRAYPSRSAGLQDYINQLKVNFPSIPAAARTGDALIFTTAIRDSHYAPDVVPEKHASSIALLAKEFREKGLFASLPKALAASSEQSSSSAPQSVSSLPLFESGPEDLPVLRVGSKGTAVELFRILSIGGSGPLTVIDIEKRVKNWQASKRLRVDGVIGNKQGWPFLINMLHQAFDRAFEKAVSK